MRIREVVVADVGARGLNASVESAPIVPMPATMNAMVEIVAAVRAVERSS